MNSLFWGFSSCCVAQADQGHLDLFNLLTLEAPGNKDIRHVLSYGHFLTKGALPLPGPVGSHSSGSSEPVPAVWWWSLHRSHIQSEETGQMPPVQKEGSVSTPSSHQVVGSPRWGPWLYLGFLLYAANGGHPALAAPQVFQLPGIQRLFWKPRDTYCYESTGFKGVWGPPPPCSVAHYTVGQGCSVPIASLCLGLREELLGAKRIETGPSHWGS